MQAAEQQNDRKGQRRPDAEHHQHGHRMRCLLQPVDLFHPKQAKQRVEHAELAVEYPPPDQTDRRDGSDHRQEV
ncbi:hypothetical protein SDC9_175672 [bioreactor metagenome]|uniref:Uncharacterized protein n=1 Tax=bioreactor metagenome TaxID=1076179 RepID=A0A645GMQ7_9ZZZZ